MASQQKIQQFLSIIKNFTPDISITILEIGARPFQDKSREPYWALLEMLPSAEIHAFEVDESLCKQLNAETPKQVTYHPLALGRPEKDRTFYETVNPMCSSLYKPNEALLNKYSQLEPAFLKAEHKLDTHALDAFLEEQSIPSIDMIKIDIQGAELECFEHGLQALRTACYIHTEVEFVEVYEGQPLFRDIDAFLSSRDFMLQKFPYLDGRSLKPVQLPKEAPISQLMWCDAIYIPNILTLAEKNDATLLKLALFAQMYHSPDLSFHCLSIVDERNNSDLTKQFAMLYNK